MKPLNSYDKKGILAEEVFVEIFEQEDAIRRAQMLLSFQDRAKELGVKGQFDTMVKAFEKAEKETQQKQRHVHDQLAKNRGKSRDIRQELRAIGSDEVRILACRRQWYTDIQ